MGPRDFPFQHRWQLKPLLGFHLAAFTLLASWMIPPGYELWRALDEIVFFQLNGSLAEGDSWQYFWALANVRLADLVPLTVLLLSLTFPIAGLRREQLQPALLGFILLMVLMFLFRKTLHVLTVNMGLSGDSPSLQLQPVFYLSELVPELPTKDRAQRSFPGDHAAVIWSWAGYLLLITRSRIAALALLLGILFTLPRMVGGAHWFSDNYVGGIAVALLTLGWAFYTPILARPLALVHRALKPVFAWMGRSLPLIGRLPFFRPGNRPG